MPVTALYNYFVTGWNKTSSANFKRDYTGFRIDDELILGYAIEGRRVSTQHKALYPKEGAPQGAWRGFRGEV